MSQSLFFFQAEDGIRYHCVTGVQTCALPILIDEIGGSDEEHAAELLGRGSRLKAVAFISGRTAPEGKRMGHAGAIISGNRGTAKSKEEAFRRAEVAVAETTDEIVGLLS